MIKVSVVIPVYKAEKFLEKAVESVLQQQEVEEILLIEDGSPDNSLEVCKALAEKHAIITLLQHKNGENRGASATRNLGMKRASQPYLAFLDADDFYLPDRFRAENKIFASSPSVDGVYGALGFYYYGEENKEKMDRMFNTELTTLTEKLAPEELKYALLGMLRSDKGYFALDTLTIKKDLAERAGYISEEFDLHEDTHFIIKLSFLGKLLPGIIDRPIGMRGVHEHNRITSNPNTAHSKFLMYKALEQWVNTNVTGEEHAKRVIKKDRMVFELLSSKKSRPARALQLIPLFRKEPLSFYVEYSFNMLMYGIFGVRLGKALVRARNSLLGSVFTRQAKRWDRVIYPWDYN